MAAVNNTHYFSPLANLTGESLALDHPVIRWHLLGRGILVREELEKKLSVEEALREEEGERQFLQDVVRAMQQEQVFISLPFLFKTRLIGIFNLGAKLSGDMYTREDLELLITLAGQSAIAMENAKLYQEIMAVKNYNEDLLESLTNGVVSVDRDGIVLTFNVKASELTGLSPEQWWVSRCGTSLRAKTRCWWISCCKRCKPNQRF